jgi:hypothetical protein
VNRRCRRHRSRARCLQGFICATSSNPYQLVPPLVPIAWRYIGSSWPVDVSIGASTPTTPVRTGEICSGPAIMNLAQGPTPATVSPGCICGLRDSTTLPMVTPMTGPPNGQRLDVTAAGRHPAARRRSMARYRIWIRHSPGPSGGRGVSRSSKSDRLTLPPGRRCRIHCWFVVMSSLTAMWFPPRGAHARGARAVWDDSDAALPALLGYPIGLLQPAAPWRPSGLAHRTHAPGARCEPQRRASTPLRDRSLWRPPSRWPSGTAVSGPTVTGRRGRFPLSDGPTGSRIAAGNWYTRPRTFRWRGAMRWLAWCDSNTLVRAFREGPFISCVHARGLVVEMLEDLSRPTTSSGGTPRCDYTGMVRRKRAQFSCLIER